jgi:hypothetical protein
MLEQLTNNNYGGGFPQISGNNIVWQGGVGGSDPEIFFYNGSTTTRLTNNNYDDYTPQISGNNIVWVGEVGGSDGEIFYYNGSTTTGNQFELEPWATQQGTFWDTQQWLVGNFNGDGRDDIVKAFNKGSLANIDVHTSNAINTNLASLADSRSEAIAKLSLTQSQQNTLIEVNDPTLAILTGVNSSALTADAFAVI